MNQTIQILLRNAVEHIRTKDLIRARELLLKAQCTDPQDSEPIRFLAVIAAMEFRFQDALELINQAIMLNPKNAISYSNKGNILKELGRYQESLDALDMAIQFLPSYAEAYSNKGNVLQELYRYEDSIEWYDKAIELNPQYAEAYSNKGNALKLLNRYEEALGHYHISTAINPKNFDAYWHKALAQLRNGDFENGWKNYEARWFKSNPVKFSFPQIPRLEGVAGISEKKVLIWSEQGLGDSIQFSRYIKLLKANGADVTYLVPQALLKVFEPLKKYCTLTTAIDENSFFDFHSPLLSLPLIFSTVLASVPANVPYIVPDSEKVKSLLSFVRASDRLKVGLIWNGGFRIGAPELWAVNKRRNIELDQIAALKGVEGVDFYSMQKGDPAESELIARKDLVWPELVNCAELLNDFSDTAALMESLDLIISVDTSSAHLAGALGKPVWILNRYDSCWRWLNGRVDSPWYPTAKIYQQKQPGNWDEVIVRVKADLNDLAQKKHSAI